MGPVPGVPVVCVEGKVVGGSVGRVVGVSVDGGSVVEVGVVSVVGGSVEG